MAKNVFSMDASSQEKESEVSQKGEHGKKTTRAQRYGRGETGRAGEVAVGDRGDDEEEGETPPHDEDLEKGDAAEAAAGVWNRERASTEERAGGGFGRLGFGAGDQMW